MGDGVFCGVILLDVYELILYAPCFCQCGSVYVEGRKICVRLCVHLRIAFTFRPPPLVAWECVHVFSYALFVVSMSHKIATRA